MIKTVFIHSHGDPSVGIPSADFEMTVWIHPQEDLSEWRRRIGALYDDMTGETVRIIFDIELKQCTEHE